MYWIESYLNTTGCKSPYLERTVGASDLTSDLPPGLEVGRPPTDRFNLLYLTLVLHGIGTLMPWNIFINAKTVSYVSRLEVIESIH